MAKAGNAELAEVAVQALDVARPRSVRARYIVVVAAEQIERTGRQSRQSAEAARVDLARPYEEGDTDIAELAVGEARSEVTGVAVAGADEEFQAALFGQGISCRAGAIAGHERIPKSVEPGPRRHQGRLEGRQCLGGIDQQ